MAFVALRIVAPDQTLRAVAPVLVALVAGSAWYLLAHARARAAIHVLVFGVWSTVTCIAVFTDGVRAPVIIAYPVIILMVCWMIHVPAGLFVAGLTVAATTGLVLAESSGLLPRPLPSSTTMHGGDQVVIYILATILAVFLVRTYQTRLTELRRVGNELARRTVDLEASKDELHRAQAVATVGSWAYNIGADSIRLSAETCRIFGLPDASAGHYDAYLARVHPDDRGAVDRAWQAAMKGDPFDLEHRIVAGRAIRWVRQKAQLRFAPDGAALGAVGVTQDITERRQTENALKQSELRFRSFVENVNDVLFALTPSGMFSYVSPQWREAFGYEISETIGQPFLPFVHPDDVAACVAFLGDVIETGLKQSGVEYRVLCKDGSYRWYKANASLMRDPVDGTSTLVGIGRDITERKQFENELLESEFRWKLAAEGSGDGVWDWDIQTDNASYSRRWKEMLGYSEDDILPINQDWKDRVHPDDHVYVAESMQAYLEGRSASYLVEYRLRC